MFTRKKSKRILSDWASLQDALVSFFDADQGTAGDMLLTVEWKSEKRSQQVRVSYAPTGLGSIAFISAPIIDEPNATQVSELLGACSKFLVGGIVHDGDAAFLRATVPFEGVPFSEVDRIIRQIAANADELRIATTD